MGFLVTTEGIYRGATHGVKKNSAETWTMYKFALPEFYKGITLSAQQMSGSNASIFPHDGVECSLQVGEVARLDLEISARLSNNRAYPEFKLVRVHKKQ